MPTKNLDQRPLAVATCTSYNATSLPIAFGGNGEPSEGVVSLPVDPANGVAVLIHKIEMKQGTPSIPQATSTGEYRNNSGVRLSTRQGLKALPSFDLPSTLFGTSKEIIKCNVATAGTGLAYHSEDATQYYPGGLLIADPKLSLYVYTDGDDPVASTAGQVRIYYELVQVSREDFFAAMSVFQD